MTNAFTKAQFMAAPSGAVGPVPIGAVKAGTGVAISADGTISLTGGGGTVSDIVATNGLQGGGQGPQVFLGLLPPTSTTIGGVRTVDGSGVSIDSDGVIRAVNSVQVTGGLGIVVTAFGGGSFNVALRPSGSASNQLGGVYVPTASFSGLSLASDGQLKLSPPVASGIGGVKAGVGCTIAADGTISATGSGGTIVGVLPGVGLVGGGTSGTVTLSAAIASAGSLGSIKVGTNLSVDPDGTLNALGGTLQSVTTAGATTNKLLTFNSDPAGTVKTTLDYQGLTGLVNNVPTIGFETASGRLRIFSQTGPGTLVLSMGANGIDGVVTTPASGQRLFLTGDAGVTLSTGATEQCVISTIGVNIPNRLTASGFSYPTADGIAGQVLTTNGSKNLTFTSVLPASGGTMTGNITFASSQTFPAATLLTTGVVKPDGTSISVDSAGTISAVTTVGSLQQVTSVGATTNNSIAVLLNSAAVGLSVANTASTSLLQLSPDKLTIDNGSGDPGINIVGFGTPSATVTGGGFISVGLGGGAAYVEKIRLNGTTGAATVGQIIAGGITYPTTDGAAGQVLTTNGSGVVTFQNAGASNALLLTGGTMTGNIVFAGTQTFPTATTLALGVVRPDGTTITINGSGVISAAGGAASLPLTGGTMTGNIVFAGTQTFAGTLPLTGGTMTGDIVFSGTQTFAGTLPLSGGTMTGAITFAAGQTFPGTISATLLDVTGDIVYASAANTPASLPIGTAGSILAVNGGLPAWRTATQLGLLTTASAATTYAPLNSPTLTGAVVINSGGSAGSNALTVSGGSLVLSTSFTPATSGDPGSTGEITWDGGYLYICTAPNTWGRIAIDTTPF
jgi:hypothetical protein